MRVNPNGRLRTTKKVGDHKAVLIDHLRTTSMWVASEAEVDTSEAFFEVPDVGGMRINPNGCLRTTVKIGGHKAVLTDHLRTTSMWVASEVVVVTDDYSIIV